MKVGFPSLKRLALVKAAMKYWQHDDVKESLENFEFGSKTDVSISNNFKSEIVNDVMKQFSDLRLHENLLDDLKSVTRSIGHEILRWGQFHNSLLCDKSFITLGLKNLCWTTYGTVDRKKTAEVLIQCQKLDVTQRFKLACIYCLENSISYIWEILPHDYKNYLVDEGFMDQKVRYGIIAYWINEMHLRSGGMEFLDYSYLDDVFPTAVYSGNLEATEYFFLKLTRAERKSCLVTITKNVAFKHCNKPSTVNIFSPEHYTEVLLFLLAQLNEKELANVFHKNLEVLECFLDWPWHVHFLVAAEYSWVSYSKQDFYHITEKIILKMQENKRGYNYPVLFNEFYKSSPASYKLFFMKKCITTYILEKLFLFGRVSNLELVLENASVPERMELFLSEKGKDLCELFLYHESWDWLNTYVEFIPSKLSAIKFRDELRDHYNNDKWDKIEVKEDPTWNRFVQLVHDVCKSKKIWDETISGPSNTLSTRPRL